MAHEYGTRSKSQLDPSLQQLEENRVSSVNNLQDEITKLKDIIIKNLQEDNKRLRSRCSNLENKLVSLETSINALEQYGRRNNLVLNGIPDTIADELKSTVISVLGDIDVEVESSDIEDCHRIGKPDKANSKKTIIRFANRKYCKKALLNRKKLDKCVRFNLSTKIFVNGNLKMMNENIAYSCRKLKQGGLIFECFTRDAFVHIKNHFWVIQEDSSHEYSS